MVGKRKSKVVLAVLLVVAAGGIFFTTFKPGKPDISINFIGFTNRPEGEVQANFAIVYHGNLRARSSFRYAARGADCDAFYEFRFMNASLDTVYFPLDIVDCAHNFRLELTVQVPRWKQRSASTPAVYDIVAKHLVDLLGLRKSDSYVFTSPWIPNPNPTNQATAKSPGR